MPEEAKGQDNQIAIDARIEEFFRAGVHFGYAKTRRHPQMREFIAGIKNNIEIFQLEKVREHFDRALGFIEELGKQNGLILWVGTKPAASSIIREVAESLQHPFIDVRWLGGTLTNFDKIRERVNYWQNLVMKQKEGELEKYTKHERIKIQKEIDRLTRSFEGLTALEKMPRALFAVDIGDETNAVKEANIKNIPVVALLNTDCDPSKVEYPIPGNDNARESIRFILIEARDAYLRGRAVSANDNAH